VRLVARYLVHRTDLKTELVAASDSEIVVKGQLGGRFLTLVQRYVITVFGVDSIVLCHGFFSSA
jgi:hypothetical protein